MMPVAIITGGASGIGLAVAERLLDDGWKVAVIDADGAALIDAEDLLGGEEAVFLSADVTDEDEIAEVFNQAVDTLGPVTALVNAACVKRHARFEETSAELFRQVLEINLVGSFIAAEAALERMGHELAVVNMVSVSALRANSGDTAHGASQAGVKMMTEVMALELAGRGVRVNCVAAAPIETPDVAFGPHGGRQRAWLERTPLSRAPSVREVTAAVAYLLSPEAGSVTGHTLVVDGGFSVSGLLPGD
ncbi:SDR family oxidoreductase [Chelativorans sp. AA-79]|uniref:SDR family NAD(P)-dependent oxidoreductase n=1 Tax=Chelativorans sp. AA-79 TaxID=3028735 RepID=UPI0023F645C8|nr:SDR family oxidoreductase [Chelativorans sp. AA-79]WEX07770.1 SDR family NAD(P)-dependent oxidoreductase [Chelativorans sp. AA-79]